MSSSLGAVGASFGAERFRLDRSDMLAEVQKPTSASSQTFTCSNPRDCRKMAASPNASILQFEGCNFLRQRLVLATLSGRPVRIRHIRKDSSEPGLKGECFSHYLIMCPAYIQVAPGPSFIYHGN